MWGKFIGRWKFCMVMESVQDERKSTGKEKCHGKENCTG